MKTNNKNKTLNESIAPGNHCKNSDWIFFVPCLKRQHKMTFPFLDLELPDLGHRPFFPISLSPGYRGGSRGRSPALGRSPLPTCTYDQGCPSSQKCCHVEVTRGSYTMRCRYPLRNSRRYWLNWKETELEKEAGARHLQCIRYIVAFVFKFYTLFTHSLAA